MRKENRTNPKNDLLPPRKSVVLFLELFGLGIVLALMFSKF